MGTQINGTEYSDKLVATGTDDTLVGGAGRDYIQGGAGNNIEIGDSGDDTFAGDLPSQGIYDLGNDSIDAGAGDDYMRSQTGEDTFNGGEGNDRVSYYNVAHAINVNLATGLVNDGSGADDHLISIELISGTSGYADTMLGGDGAEVFYGNGGDDSLDGGAGTDTAGYQFATGGVTVSLADGVSSGADGNDQLANFENLEGSFYNDVLTGDDGANLLSGLGGNDTLAGGKGNDTLRGGGGDDRAVFNGNKSDFSITTDENGDILVQGLGDAATEGTDRLSGISTLVFNDGTVTLAGVELPVSIDTSDNGVFPVVTSLATGGYAITYRDFDSNGDGIMVRQFDAEGRPVGEELRVNTTETGDQRGPSVGALRDGSYVVVWDSNTGLGQPSNNPNWDIKLQRYDADGNKLGDEVLVNTTTAYAQRFPVVTGMDNYGYIVSWQSRQENSGNDFGIYAQKYNWDGSKNGDEFKINTNAAGNQTTPLIEQLLNEDGNMVAVWRSAVGSGSSYALQLLDANGNKVGSEQVMATAATGHSLGTVHLSALSNGGFAATWLDTSSSGEIVVMARAFNASGVAVGAAFVAGNASTAHSSSDVVGLDDGSFMVVWDNQTEDGSSIVGHRYDGATQASLTSEFRIDSPSIVGGKSYPSVATTGDGSIVVTWSGGSSGALTESGGVFQQLIDADGRPELVVGSNQEYTPATPSFTVQTVVGGIEPDADPAYFSALYYQLHDALDSGATVTNSHLALTGLSTYGNTITIRSGETVLATVGVGDDGRWAADIWQLEPGQYQLTATVTDLFGNVSASSDAFELNVSAVLVGTEGDDDGDYWLDQGAGDANQLLIGLAGNDEFIGGGGNDTMVGGGGQDSAIYVGTKSNYTISTNANGAVVVTDNRTDSPNGSDTLYGVKTLKFIDTATGNEEDVTLEALEHVVSTNPGNRQVYQSVTELAGSHGYVIAYRDGDSSGDGVVVRQFTGLGTAYSVEHRVNSTELGDQRGITVGALDDGGYVVVWNSNPAVGPTPGSYGWNILMQRYDAYGNKVGSETLVNTTTDYSQRFATVTSLSDGGFVIAWQSQQENDGGDTGIYAQKFGADGAKVGEELHLNTTTTGFQDAPVLHQLADGSVVAMWRSAALDGSVSYQMQHLDASFNPVGGETEVYVAPAGASPTGLHFTALGNGGYAATWVQGVGDSYVVMARAFGADGTPAGAAFVVANSDSGHYQADITALDDGSFMVVWDNQYDDQGNSAIVGQRFDGDSMEPLTGQFVISDQRIAGAKNFPTIAGTGDGNIVVTWSGQGEATLTNGGGIYQQIIDPDGNPFFFTGTSSSAAPATPTFKVQTVVGGAAPVLNPDYASAPYYLLNTALSDKATISNSHLAVTGTAAFGSTIVIKSDGVVLATTGVNDDGRWGADIAHLNDGAYKLVVTVTDVYGRTSAPSSIFNLTVSTAKLDGTANADGANYWLEQGANGNAQTLNGLAGNDTLNGNGGADTLVGGAGDDTYIIGNAGIKVTEASGGGTDVMVGTVDMTLADNVENGVLTGDLGHSLSGNALDNKLTGSSGNDTLDGLGGKDTMTGGAGNDVYTVNDVADVIVEAEGGGTDTVNVAMSSGAYALGANVENAVVAGTGAGGITGNDLNNALTGNAAANKLTGGLGNDTLNGGAGNDSMDGGKGNDTYFVDASGDSITEAADGGFDSVVTALTSYTLAANAERVIYTGTAAATITGNAGDNQLMSGTGADSAGSGNDKLDGQAGNDLLIGRGGNDTLLGGAGSDTLFGGAGNDSLDGGAITDKIGTSDFNIALYDGATSGVNVNFATGVALDGSGGTDKLVNINFVSGGDYNDTLTGSTANVLEGFQGGQGDDSIDGGEVTDLINQSNNNMVLYLAAESGVTVDLQNQVADGDDTGHDILKNITMVRGSDYDDSITGSDNGYLTETFSGEAGDDTIDGGAGNDFASYDFASSAVDVDLGGGIAIDGDGGTDTLLNIEGVRGSAFGDHLASNGAPVAIFIGNGGNDTIDGNSLYWDIAEYSTSKAGITVDLAAGTAKDGLGGTDVLTGIEEVRGSAFNDSISGSNAGYEWFVGGAGNDTIDGRGGMDGVGYSNAGSPVKIDLAAGTAAKGTSGSDKLIGIEDASGGEYNDTLTGSAQANMLAGHGGNDTIDGGAGNDLLYGDAGNDSVLGGTGADTLTGGAGNDTLDGGAITDRLNYNDANTVAYYEAATGVTVNLATGKAQDGLGGTDTLLNINAVQGSSFEDVLTGSSGKIFEQFDGGTGNDTIDGGIISDRLAYTDSNLVSYQSAFEGVTVDLDEGTASGGGGNDTLININSALGSRYDDQLLGSDSQAISEVLEGSGGNDTIDGRGGFDIVSYEHDGGSVTVNLADGTALDGLGGEDVLSNMEGVRGSAFADVLIGSDAGYETFQGNGGNDTIDGGGGFNRADYQNSSSGIVANLGTGLVQDGLGGTDTLVNIQSLRGSSLADVLTGSDAGEFEIFEGLAGNDTIDGKGGEDQVDYSIAASGVTVDLGTGKALDGFGSTDTLLNIEEVWGSTFGDSITGNANGNFLGGNGGNDTLNGAGGDDYLLGGSGNDSLSGGIGNDTLVSGGGTDVLDGGDGASDTVVLKHSFDFYTVTRPNLTDTVLTGEGETITVRKAEYFKFGDDDLMTLAQVQFNIASIGDDSLAGTDGSDELNGGAGKDTMEGKHGDDIYFVDDALDVIVETDDAEGGNDSAYVNFAKAGTYVLAANLENAAVTSAASIAVNLTGNGSDNALTGNAAANKLIGAGGNDTLDGGAGNDTLEGGAGNDSYVVDASGDVVTEGVDAGYDRVETGLASYTLATNVEALKYTGSGAFAGTGNALGNVITGGSGKDVLNGLAGDDTLNGGSGDDTLNGGDGNDRLIGRGVDLIDGGAGVDTVMLTYSFSDYTVTRPNATDIVLTKNSGEIITLRNVEYVGFDADEQTLSINTVAVNLLSAGDDYLLGDSSANTLNGGLGNDTMEGLGGNDSYTVNAAGDKIVEVADGGVDDVTVAFTAAGSYVLGDYVENATVTGTLAVNVAGNAQDNILTGNSAANKLEGGAGNDQLVGGAGNDSLIGGDGDDIYVVDAAGDVVTEAAGGSSGTDLVKTALASYTLAVNVENLEYTGSVAFSGTGNASANSITGMGGNDKLSGLAGSDTLQGGAGNDTLDGGIDNDSLVGGAGNDSLIGGDGNDTLDAGIGTDVADGGAGSGDVLNVAGNFADFTRTRESFTDTRLVNSSTGENILVRGVETFFFNGVEKSLADVNFNLASSGDDTLSGADDKNDTLDGGLGIDRLVGMDGDDTYVVNVAGDTVVEEAGKGHDKVTVAFTAAGSYVMSNYVEDATVTGTLAVNVTGNDEDNIITGNSAANKLDGGVGSDQLNGGAGNDSLTGGAGNDTLDGGVGSDSLVGGAGDDTYVVDVSGDVVNETVTGSSGTDLVKAGVASYTLGLNVENLEYTGTAAFTGTGNASANSIKGMGGNDKLTGLAGADSLDGGAGNDTLDGGADNDTLLGGAGNDSLLGGDGNDSLESGGGVDVADGGAGTDTLTVLGVAAAYTITKVSATDTKLVHVSTGETVTFKNIESIKFSDSTVLVTELSGNVITSGSDELSGTDGADTLNGGAGADIMAGGLGSDTYVVDVAGDTVVESADAGTDLVQVAFTTAGQTYLLGDNVENATVTGTVATHLTGNGLDNILTGNAAANTLTGGAGNDKLIGGAGSDSMLGGTGDDVYVVDATGDQVVEADGAGTDRVETALASYTLSANVENLVFTGTAAFTGNGNALDNTIEGAGGADKLSGLAGNDSLVGGAGNDTLDGGIGNDVLLGGAGNDSLAGGDGADELIGGAGNNSYTGGLGADTFWLSAGSVNTVSDFASGMDKLKVDQSVFSIGNGDGTVDNAVTRDAAGGFAANAELVVFTQNAAGTGPAVAAKTAAALIGSASSAYAIGDKALFVVDNGKSSTVFLFTSSGADAAVSEGELTQLAVLTGTPSTAVGDYQLFVAG